MTLGSLIHDSGQQGKEERRFIWPPVMLWLLCTIAFCGFLSEGAVGDWSTIYLERVVHAHPAVAPLGLALFSVAMTVCRFFGDRLRSALGDAKALCLLSAIALLGYAATLSFLNPLTTLFGLTIMGIGLSVIVPILFSMAGKIPNIPPGEGLSLIAGFGYPGILLGPPLIGFAADYVGLRGGLLVVMVALACMNVICFTCWRSGKLSLAK